MSTSAAYYRFGSPHARPGVAVIALSRAAACGNVPASHIVIRISRLHINKDHQPAAGKLLAVRRRTVHSTPCDSFAVRVPVRLPYRVDVTADRTFQPSQYDPRQLSAQIGFGFVPGAKK